MSHTYWRLLTSAEQPVAVSGTSALVAQLLYNRGITDATQIASFLSAESRLEADPFLLSGMPQAVNRIYRALLGGEKIAIYGDFDADGITATALLVQGISALGGDVIPYIPHRLTDGYGVKVAALEKLHRQGVSLVITVDCGITALNEAKRSQKIGMDMIITDHHIPLDSLPSAMAVIDPKLDGSVYPFPELAGVGVAFKLLQALLQHNGRDELLSAVLDLVALGTVTDMVPLTGENRYWVKGGLELLNRTDRLGLQEIMRCTGTEPGSVDAGSISWVFGPRLNAAGRLDDAVTSYQLLLTKDSQEARQLALQLEKSNTERQRLTNEALSRAKEKITAAGVGLPLLMAGDTDYPAGIMGLVAGRLSEAFCRPVILFRLGSEVCRGSGRSIREFDLVAALKNCSDLLLNFGGHTKAAGFTVPTQNLDQLKQRLFTLAQDQLAGLDLRPHIDIDAEVPLSTFGGRTGGRTISEIQQLAPFGSGNPVPTFLSRRVMISDCRLLGKKGEHLGLKLNQQGVTWDAIGFRLGNHSAELASYLDIVYSIEERRWNGVEELRLNLLDFAPSD